MNKKPSRDISSLSDSEVARLATEKAIRERDCKNCIAKAGEPCWDMGRGGVALRMMADGPMVRAHIGRFPTNIDPRDYLAEESVET